MDSAGLGMDGKPQTWFYTNKGVGEWWAADFTIEQRAVGRVRILNRGSCQEPATAFSHIVETSNCYDRLASARVELDGQYCGSLPAATPSTSDNWWEVRCSKPLVGSSIKVVTKTDTYLHFADIEVYGRRNPEFNEIRFATTDRAYFVDYQKQDLIGTKRQVEKADEKIENAISETEKK